MTDHSVHSPDESVEPTISHTSVSLLERAKSRDQAAWERIIRLYSPLVYRWCREQGLQEADAADVGQEVFQSVAAALPTFQRHSDRGSFRGWLKTVTRSKIVDYFRRKKKQPVAPGGSDAQLSLKQLEDENQEQPSVISQETRLLYDRALELIQSEFNQVHWQAFYRTTVDQQPAASVAEELGISRHVVYNARSRILYRIREEFAELIDDSYGQPTSSEDPM